MMRRRAIALAAALAFLLASSAADAQQAKPDTKKRSKQEQAEIEQLVKAVDGMMAGQPAPSDVQMSLTPYFLKSQEQRTFVPFVLDLKGAPTTDAAVYVRVSIHRPSRIRNRRKSNIHGTTSISFLRARCRVAS